MAKYSVTCKEKHSLYERIIAIGCVNVATGSTHRFLEDDAIKRIEDGTDTFHVVDAKGNSAAVKVEQREGRKFLITERDGVKTDNLLFLPDCPTKKPDGSGAVRTIVAAASHGDIYSPHAGF
jgi:hypothetical protein